MISRMDVAERLRTEGYRVTTPRRAVWEVLRHADHHLSVDEIHQRVAATAPDVNLASIYRTLALLAELDLAHEVQLGDGKGRWEQAHHEKQIHCVCRVCASVTHHPADLLADARAHLTQDHGFVAEAADLVVTGVCAACAEVAQDDLASGAAGGYTAPAPR